MSSSLHPVFVNHHLMVCRHRVVRMLMLVDWRRLIRAQHASCHCALDGQQHRQQNQQPDANFSHGWKRITETFPVQVRKFVEDGPCHRGKATALVPCLQPGFRRHAVRPLRHHRLCVSQPFDDGAVWPLVSRAAGNKVLKSSPHGLQFTQLCVELAKMCLRQGFHLATGPLSVLPQTEQLANLLN